MIDCIYLHCVVKVAFLVEEPEDAVVWLRVDALLLQCTNLILLARQDVQFEHLEEGITVLRSELNRET